jgi:Ribosomal protein L11 methyltransferase (PrmA)/PRMT5 oligomerisation domain
MPQGVATVSQRSNGGSQSRPGAFAYESEEVWLPFSETLDVWDSDFHQLLVNDKLRVDAYQAAIREVVKPGMTVVDLGTGSGILALWALESGASRVYGIEMEEVILASAVKRIRSAGYSERFTPVRSLSQNVVLGERVDVLLSEIIGNLADNENLVPILLDASRRLLRPGGTQIPQRVTSYLVPVEAPTAHANVAKCNWRVLSERYSARAMRERNLRENPFNFYYDAIIPSSGYLAEPSVLRAYAGTWEERPIYKVRCKWRIRRPGRLTGFKGYFLAQLSDHSKLDISGDDIGHGTTSDSWKHAYLPIETPIGVESEDLLELWFSRSVPKQSQPWGRQRYTWAGQVLRNGRSIGTFRQSTLPGNL